MVVAVPGLISGATNRVEVPLHLLMPVLDLTITPFTYRTQPLIRSGVSMLVFLILLKFEKFVRLLEELFGRQASDPHMVSAANGYSYCMNRFWIADVRQEVFIFYDLLESCLDAGIEFPVVLAGYYGSRREIGDDGAIG
jgi:hypothetical protein